MGTETPRPAAWNRTSRPVLGQFLVTFLPAAAMLTALMIYMYSSEVANDKAIDAARETLAIGKGKTSVLSAMEGVVADLLVLARYDSNFPLDGSPSADLLTRWASIFLDVSEQKQVYDQIRYLDESGMEILRIDYSGGDPIPVARQNLQDKSARYYFADTFSLDKGEVFISPLDLNVEGGQIETPLKPMLRVGTPVFDRSGNKRGIVLVNYFGEELVERFRKVAVGAQGETMILNRDGYWLHAARPELEWGFMLETDERFEKHFPEAWMRINEREAGQFETANGLFTFDTVYPLRSGQLSSTGSVEVHAPSDQILGIREYYWHIVTRIPPQIFQASERRVGEKWLFFLGPLLILLFAGSLSIVYTRAKRAEAERRLQLTQFAVDHAADSVFWFDPIGTIQNINKAACAVLGYFREELLGTPLEVIVPELQKEQFGDYWETVRNDGFGHHEFSFLRKGGRAFPAEVVANYVNFEGTELICAFVRDISERKEFEQRIEFIATHDTLTGLPTRDLFLDRLSQALAIARRNGTAVALLFVDLDGFKPLNDSFGHKAGDLVLHNVADRLALSVRDSDTVSRYGGDEFTVLLTNLVDRSGAAVVAERMISLIGEPFTLDNKPATVGASIGIACYPDHGASVESLLSLADAAMYVAKKEGGHRYVFAPTERGQEG